MQPYVIGIAGGTASGKTTLARRLFGLALNEEAALIELDRYYRCQDHVELAARTRVNYDHPASLEFDLLMHHLRELRLGRSVRTPVYDFANHTRRVDDTTRVEPRPLIIVEGILVLAVPELRDLFDLRVFVDCPAHIRLERRIVRDVRERGRTREGVIEQWHATVQPMHEQFCEPSRESAHLLIDGSSSLDAPLASLWATISERTGSNLRGAESRLAKLT